MATQEEALPQDLQVFINYRGAELHYGFVSHLEWALKLNGVNVCVDQVLVRGAPLRNLIKMIEESRIAIVIFSSRYTESRWCLEELVRIKELVEEGKLVVIPVFYKLMVSEVKDLKKEFGEHFRDLEKDTSGDQIKKWKKALDFVSQRMGLVFNGKSDNEAYFIHCIAEHVKIEISRISLKQIELVKPSKIQVFISFQGDQLCNSFISHLVAALRGSGINVFIDNQDQRGEDLNTLFKRIKDSGIAIVVFSSRYTESEWCLNELVKIKERAHQGLLKVIPIYFKMTPYNVKRLKGEFGDHFRDKEYMYKSDGPKVKRWKEAIAFFSHLFGLVLDEESDEFSFINRIVAKVKIIEKSLDRLSEQQDDVFMDYPSSEDLEGLDGGRDGILWDKNSNRNPMEAEIVQPEAKSRRADGLDPSKGETNSSSTVVKLPPNHQMLRYGFLSHLVKILESYKITSQLGMIIGFLLLLFFCLQQVAYMMSNPFTGEGSAINGILENVPNVLESIPAERTENPRNKFTEFPTYIYVAKPERSSSNAKTNDDFLDRTCSSSPMDGKVKPPNIQVFINFRGEQLRNNFVGYLVAALRGSGINVFIDNHEQRGEDLNTLFKRIEDSGIAIVVFSSRYTESKWCLDELVKIKERVHQGLLKVLPIFYKVTPGNVKRLKGEFGDNFRDKEYMFASDEPKIKRWKEAIVFVSHKFAMTLDEKSVLEIDFIETIVNEVLKMLQAISTVGSGQSSH